MKQSVRYFRENSATRSWFVYLFDVLAVVFCWIGAYSLRFNFDVPLSSRNSGWQTLAWVLPLYAILFRVFGLYRGIWMFASMPDLVRITKAVMCGAVLSVIFAFMSPLSPPVPRSVLVVAPILLLFVMGGSRGAYRYWKEYRQYGGLVAEGTPVLLLGAGAAGVNIARELNRTSQWRLAGVLDDDRQKRGRELMGHYVLGAIDELAYWAAQLRVKHAIVAMPSANSAEQKRAIALCVEAGIKPLVVPSLHDMINPNAGLASLREIRIEDLLGRDPVTIDSGNIGAMLAGRSVMVTGAGGSIGSELCRQIARFQPAALVAYELNEYALYALIEEFVEHFPQIQVMPVTGDVRDGAWLDAVFDRYAPSVVFHAAAYKHVPLMEEDNAWQAMRNNVLGTWRLVQAAMSHSVERFVLVSTDKAVNPTNVMGATKRLAEMICQNAQLSGCVTRFECVRFGNVLGSAGSVVPKFAAQIERGGPLTVTHPEITRFFMSIPEAAQLVLQAAGMGEGGEIFVLDMGEPVKIVDLAKAMIRLSGHAEDEIRIEFSGLRPGEKLYEELLADNEQTRPTHHPKLRVAKAREADPRVIDEVIAWLRAGTVHSSQEVKRELRRWVPEYAPSPQRPTLLVVPGVVDREQA